MTRHVCVKCFRCVSLLLVTLLCSLNVSAAYVANKAIGRFYISGGYVNVQIIAAPTDTCVYYLENFRFNANTTEGQAMHSLLITAKSNNKNITLWYNPSTTPGTNQTNGCTTSTLAVITGIGMD